MIVYRIARDTFAHELHSSGRPNRWNQAAQYVLYTSGSISLCALELLAHTNGIRPAGNFKIMHVAITDPMSPVQIEVDRLPTEWQRLACYPLTQQLGSAWYTSQENLVLQIPSAIIPQESNFVINTKHPAFHSNVSLIKTTDFIWDHRFPES